LNSGRERVEDAAGTQPFQEKGQMNRIILFAVLGSALAAMDVAAQQVDLGKQYKKAHVRGLAAIVDGRVDDARDALEAFAEANPDDAEALFLLTIIHGQRTEMDRAMDRARQAVERGLPAGRFYAGPRGLLGDLLEYEPFQAYAAGRVAEPIHGPMLGCVTDRSARFWVRTSREAAVRVCVGRTAELEDGQDSEIVRTKASGDYTGVMVVDGLDPDTRYYYRVVVDDHAAPDGPPHSFRTFTESGEPAAFRVGFGGGAGYVPANERMWDTVRGFEPRAFLLLGDNVYIDQPTYPDAQKYCYYRRQSRPEYRRFVGAAPLYAIYDDHDFGDNDCWGGPDIDEPAWKRPVWRLFQQNWVNPYYGGGEAQPGCWFDASIADVDFCFLDCRYYRTHPKRPNRSMLGPVQKEWLFEKLGASRAAFKVICSSVPMATGTKPGSRDTWDGYADERAEIFDFLAERNVEGVIVLCADRHRSDVWRIERERGYPLYEFESSRLTNEHVHKQIDGALFSYNASQSFGLLSFDTTKPDPEVTYTIINIDGEEVHTFTVRRSQLTETRP